MQKYLILFVGSLGSESFEGLRNVGDDESPVVVVRVVELGEEEENQGGVLVIFINFQYFLYKNTDSKVIVEHKNPL